MRSCGTYGLIPFMMYKYLAIFLCLLPLVVADDEDPLAPGHQDPDPFHPPNMRHFCPRNQRWFQCGPPCGDRRCPRRFDQVDNFRVKCDSRKCGNPGCYCEQGSVRNEDGDCIHEDECPPQCRDNEQLDRCGNDCELKCPSSMDEVGRQPSCHRQTCGRPACVCKPGFYRSPRGVCVKLQDCPNICGPNEFYNPCGNACEDTCRRFNSGQPLDCPKICEPHGACQCKSGFYRNSRGQCVPPAMCLECRGRNEVPDKCAPPLQCQPRCGWDIRRSDDRCFRHDTCRPGCVCKFGHVRNHHNNCIPREFCNRP